MRSCSVPGCWAPARARASRVSRPDVFLLCRRHLEEHAAAYDDHRHAVLPGAAPARPPEPEEPPEEPPKERPAKASCKPAEPSEAEIIVEQGLDPAVWGRPTKQWSEEQRRAVAAWAEQHTQAQAARRFKVSNSTVLAWVARYGAERVDGQQAARERDEAIAQRDELARKLEAERRKCERLRSDVARLEAQAADTAVQRSARVAELLATRERLQREIGAMELDAVRLRRQADRALAAQQHASEIVARLRVVLGDTVVLRAAMVALGLEQSDVGGADG